MAIAHQDADAFLALAPCGLLELDSDQVILYANPYAEALTGRADGGLVGLKLQALLTVASRMLLQTRLAQELALGGRLEEVALDVLAVDGGRVQVMLNAEQTPGSDERPSRIRIAMWRAGGRRAYEAEVPKARLAAEEAAQVKADFLANISHEIRTPLNGILGIADVLAGRALDEPQREMVGIVQTSARTLERLFSDLLEISRVQAGELRLDVQPFDLWAELAGSVETVRLAAEQKGLTFVYAADPASAGRFLGDAVRIRQILGHLTANALKFTDAGQISLQLGVQGDRVRIEVADTGEGFDPARAANLFQGFVQADAAATRKRGGAGLGLGICSALVDLMGGVISARSTPGQGSVFTVDLPLERIAAAPEQGEDVSPTGRLRVLYVEDNPTNQRVVQIILEAYDVELQLADNGEQGVAAWRSGDFDVVLMDLQMPVMDGLTAIREIRRLEIERASAGRTPIAVLSGNAMDHHRREAVAAGADLHLAKPISPQALLEGINAVLTASQAAA